MHSDHGANGDDDNGANGDDDKNGANGDDDNGANGDEKYDNGANGDDDDDNGANGDEEYDNDCSAKGVDEFEVACVKKEFVVTSWWKKWGGKVLGPSIKSEACQAQVEEMEGAELW